MVVSVPSTTPLQRDLLDEVHTRIGRLVCGTDGTIVHFAKAAWSASDSGTDTWLTGVWGSSKNDLWAVGVDGAVLHKRR